MQNDIPSKPKGLVGAKLAKVPELVSYQDGAIVSREIVKKPTGNVTIFAFRPGSEFKRTHGAVRRARADAGRRGGNYNLRPVASGSRR